MKHLLLLSLVTILLNQSNTFSQQTVGLFSNTVDSYDGYTMFGPIGSKTTYLINNCGEKVHSWESNFRPALVTYLLENGVLLRSRNTGNSTFSGGGSGGGIEMLDWSGNVIWEYTLSTNTQCIHHDIEYLPNGNILAIVWDAKTDVEATQAGRELSGAFIWSEKIIEIQPDLINGGGTIVWEWSTWDHLVQDFDSSKDNYGTVSTSPQLVNINYSFVNQQQPDWLHFNSVAYNADFDQIIISNRNFSELWVIDHSTNTLEAASHTGGQYNKGGDLLYRWGNPQTYNQGTASDQLLFRQHDTHWISDSLTDGGKILVFNNQIGSNYSQVNVINPPVDPNGNYMYSGTSYLPLAFDYTYEAPIPTDFNAPNISGAQRLPNGNTLICDGPSGKFFEVDSAGNEVWNYISPVTQNGIVAQGDPISQNSVFRAYRFAPTFSGFAGHNLIPQGYIENGSTFTCNLYSVGVDENSLINSINIFPNPTNGILKIQGENLNIEQLEIFNT
ncbi:MAG: aryl-sulfate sulfotransferase, partial [Bacteroidota bacterium]